MNLDELEESINQGISRQELGKAIDDIVKWVEVIINDPSSLAFVFGSERLDALCFKIGASAYSKIERDLPPKLTTNTNIVVSIASYLAPYGGHTLVLEDFIKAQPLKKHVIILTDLFGNIEIDFLKKRFGHLAEIKILFGTSSLTKLEKLITELAELSPEQVFLFNHHQDAIAISAIQPFIDKFEIMFYHHGDHHLCLGVHLPGVKHIDPHNLGFYNCKVHEKIQDNYYLPLIVERRGERHAGHLFCPDGQLTTCSSGTSNKFFIPYSFPYIELIVIRLLLREGNHIHIGDLTPDKKEEILTKMKVNGINPSRFVHVPWVQSLWDSLVEFNVDVYISSFPIGGGRAAIEAMGAATPLLMHDNHSSPFHGGVDSAYSDAYVWKNQNDFEKIIKRISREDLAMHSTLSRIHYEKNHSPDKLKTAIHLMLNEGATNAAPKLREVISDPLSRYLHMRSLIEGRLLKEYEAEIQKIETKLSKELKSLKSSRSWRLTAPLRWINSKFHVLFRKHVS